GIPLGIRGAISSGQRSNHSDRTSRPSTSSGAQGTDGTRGASETWRSEAANSKPPKRRATSMISLEQRIRRILLVTCIIAASASCIPLESPPVSDRCVSTPVAEVTATRDIPGSDPAPAADTLPYVDMPRNGISSEALNALYGRTRNPSPGPDLLRRITTGGLEDGLRMSWDDVVAWEGRQTP